MLFTERSPIKATSCMTISGGKPNNSGTWSSVCSVYLSWKYTQKPRINRQNRLTEDHVPWICLPQGDLPAVHSCCIYRSSALPEGPLGGLPSLLLTTGGSRMHLEGRVAKPLISGLMRGCRFSATSLALWVIFIRRYMCPGCILRWKNQTTCCNRFWRAGCSRLGYIDIRLVY